MKNRGLIALVLIILGVLASQFITGKQEMSQEKETTVQMKTVGVLQYVSHPALDEIYRGIQDGLKEKGYEENKNLELVFQNGQADQSKLATMSQQLLEKDSDVLVGIATPAAQALANTTKEVPLVLGAVTDPKAAHLVMDNEKTGGNITGVSDQSPVDAQLDLAVELLPEAKTIGVLYSSAEDNSAYQAKRVEEEGKKRGLSVKTYPVPSSNQIAQMVQVMTSEVDMIYLPTDNVIANAMEMVVDGANKKSIPIIPSVDTMVEQGGLATVGINQYEIGRQTGKMVADILDGKSKPESTPIYTFTTGDVIVNEQQAEKLGVTIPKDVLEKAKKTK